MTYSNFQQTVRRFCQAHKQKHNWMRIVAVMACIVVFVTTYAMILPAITTDAADLKQYLANNGGSIAAEPEVPDSCAVSGEEYPLYLTVIGGEQGFSPGIYFYKLPESVNLITTYGHDIVSSDNAMLGSWSVNENEIIVFEFHEAAQIAGIEIPLELKIKFDGTQETVVFDGDFQVNVCAVSETFDENQDTVNELAYEEPIVYAASPVELDAYVKSHNGSIIISIYDNSGNVVDGIVIEGEKYKISMGVSTGDGGFTPGTYVYQMPDGVLIEAQNEKSLVLLDGTIIGHWSATQEGLLTFVFNESVNSYQNVALSIDLIAKFDATKGNIDFDGDVNVTITPAPEITPNEPEVEKHGEVEEKPDGTKVINWSINVQGGENFPLTGQTVKDTIIGSGHTFDGADKDIWVNVWTNDGIYYSFEIDENEAIWTDTSWEYTIPDTFICIECNDPTHSANGNQHQWGNGTDHEIIMQDNWRCSFYLETVITDENVDIYENKATSGELTDTAKLLTKNGAGIIKTGELKDGVFHWAIEVHLPASHAMHSFTIWDDMRMDMPEGTDPKFAVDFDQATVKYKSDDTWLTVPDLEGKYTDKPDGTQPFAYHVWFDENDRESGSELNFWNLCTCTSGTCNHWDTAKNRCDKSYWNDRRYCRCWHQDEPIQFLIEYDTVASADIIAEYGGQGVPLRNTAYLNYKEVIDGEAYSREETGYDDVDIPGVFNKTMLEKPNAENQYTAMFNITVNEELQDLSSLPEENITIVDKMSETLFYEVGSLIIHQTDARGNMKLLREEEDYILTMVNSHELSIQILNPGPYKYTLDYNCVMNLAGYNGQPVKYNNSAEVWLFGTKYSVAGHSEHLTSYTATAERYQISIAKVDSASGEPLADAVFGIYNYMGNLIDTSSTDENGGASFETHMENGIIFKKNVPYYIQELRAPPGYLLDDTKQWVYFARERDESLEAEHPDILYIGENSNNFYAVIRLTNKHCMLKLPETGGSGEAICYIVSVAAFAAALLTGGGVLLRRRLKHTGKSDL